MTHTKEIVALADWGYQYCLISHSPLPDIPVFLQQSCFGSKNAMHDFPDAPLRILLETADVWKRSRMLWTHLCCLLQFWTDEAGYLEGNVFYGGLYREMSDMVQYVMMRMNNCTRGETVVTWRDVVRGTPWLKIRSGFPPPTGSVRTKQTREGNGGLVAGRSTEEEMCGPTGCFSNCAVDGCIKLAAGCST